MTTLCIAGKSQAAVDVLRGAKALPVDLVCLPNASDPGEDDWQPSLLKAARAEGIDLITLDQAMAHPDLLFVSVEFDRILRPARFASDRLFNIHFSLLPRGRGCFTSYWPLLAGDPEHGVTLHVIDAGIDSGPIIDRRAFAIGEGMTSRYLYFRCLELGAELVLQWLPRLIAGDYVAVPQPEEGATLHRRRDVDFAAEREIDFAATTAAVLRRIRALTFPEYQLPTYRGADIVAAEPALPGRSPDDDSIVVPTADGAVRLRLCRDRGPTVEPQAGRATAER